MAKLQWGAQAAVDFIKKDTPNWEPLMGIKKGAHPFYRLLNGKIRTFKQWLSALESGRADLYGKVPGPVGEILDAALESIPTPVFRQYKAEYGKQHYPKGTMPQWNKFLKAGPSFDRIIRDVVNRYKSAAALLSKPEEEEKEKGLQVLKDLRDGVASMEIGDKIADFIAFNILKGNPLKIIGAGKILTWLPVNPDLVRYYNWQREHAFFHNSEPWEVDFSYRSYPWKP